MPSRAMLMFARKPARLSGRSWPSMLEALVAKVPNRTPELPQHLALPRVEHLLGCVGLSVLQEAHGLTRRGEQVVSGDFGSLLSYTDCVHSDLLSRLLAVGRVPGSGRLPRGHFSRLRPTLYYNILDFTTTCEVEF